MTMTTERYSRTAMILHWALALALAFQMSLGWRLEDLPKGPSLFSAYQLHKSVGITILLLSLFRLAIRFLHPRPVLAGDKPWAMAAARLVHGALYLVMIGGPLTGWLIVSTAKLKVPTLIFNVLPWPHLPVPASLHEPAAAAHGLLGFLFVGLFILHVAGALRHQFFKRENILGRMIPLLSGSLPSAAKAGGVLALAIGALFLAMAGAKQLHFGASDAVGKMPNLQTLPLDNSGFKAPEGEDVAANAVAPVTAIDPKVEAAKTLDAEAKDKAEDQSKADAAKAEASKKAAQSALPQPVKAWSIQSGGRLGFTSTWVGTAIPGRFNSWDAHIQFSPDDLPHSRIEVAVDLGSVTTGTAQYDDSLKGVDFFNVAAHPKAVFTSSSITKVADGRYRAIGTLDLHGVSRPVTLSFTLKIDGNVARVSGSGRLDRTAFGVGQGEWAATDQIGGGVQVSFNFVARR
jgi:cytochrome b561/polyisoprenoid-binding protein YceI